MSHAIAARTMPRPVPALLGFIAGFVDICAYFALFGIFVAQLTGSFVLAGVRLVSGQQELMTLLAIPTFFLGGCAATVVAVMRAPEGRELPWVLALESVLLTALLVVGVATAPIEHDSWQMVIAALIGIAAMGVQSAGVRLLMKGTPSTNVMTTNTTQLAIDATVALLSACGCGDAVQASESRKRLHDYWPVLASFFLGTAVGALCFKLWGLPSLGVPVLAAYALLAWTWLSPSPSAN